jgi:glycosyltransferase involved in cell wall biosynthesis
MENRDAAEHLLANWWPVILKSYPGAILRIVGEHAPKGRYYVGGVENIQTELVAADIMLAPIRVGGGTKYKILEAMASGLPVVTSPQGAEGMLGEATRHYLLAENSDDVLGSIAYLEQNTKRLDLVINARELVEKEYSWDLIARKLDIVWNSL